MIIGITTTYQEDRGHERITVEYLRSLQRMKAVPVLLPPPDHTGIDHDTVCEIIDRIDGLLLSGGGDIEPLLYGQAERLPQTVDVFPNRDDFEIALAREAHLRDLPVFGICRGSQVMNVALDGTLCQDLLSCQRTTHVHKQPEPYTNTNHCVRIAPDTLLAHLLHEQEVIRVNSMHHQAIDKPGYALEACAWAEDGVIEGVVDPARRFYLGVQWHPEYLDDHLALFEAFTEAAREHARERCCPRARL